MISAMNGSTAWTVVEATIGATIRTAAAMPRFTTAPVTIGDALEVPEKPEVYCCRLSPPGLKRLPYPVVVTL